MRAEMRMTDRRRRQHLTFADLCRAIEDRELAASRQDDQYVLTRCDLRRWLNGRNELASARARQRPAS